MLSKILKELRGEKTKTEFARIVGVTSQAIANYEDGRMPKMEVLEKIAAATGHRIVVTIEKIEELKADN